MVKKGELTESQARIHPQKNIITRALGIDETVHADYFAVSYTHLDVYKIQAIQKSYWKY